MFLVWLVSVAVVESIVALVVNAVVYAFDMVHTDGSVPVDVKLKLRLVFRFASDAVSPPS